MSTPNRPDMEWEVLLPLLSRFLDLTSEEQAQFLENLRAERPAIFEALTEILRKETNPPPPLLEALDQERFSALELRALAPGDQVGRYRLIRSLGRGGQGTVFEGVDDRLDRQVAVKVLHALSASVRPEVIISAPEIEAAARLNHTNICPILEGTTHDGIPMVVMPYLEGRTLRQVLSAWKDEPTSKSERIAMLRSVGRSVASALTEAHRVGVIHRDIKPSNLMISKDGKVTVLDFGISHMQVGPNDGNSYSRYGTPAYLAPEQTRPTDREPDPKSDIHALGAVLYEIFTGEVPYVSATREGLFAAIREAPLPKLLHTAGGMPRDVQVVISACLQKDPNDRPTAAELREEFERLDSGLPLRIRPPSRLVSIRYRIRRHPRETALSAAALLLLLLAVGTWIWYTRNLANIAAAEIIERAAKTEDLLDLAYCKALMGRGTKEAFDAVLAREAGHPLATFGQQVWFGSHDPLAETADEISPEERAFKSAVLCYQAATRGSLSAAREALDSAVQTLLAAPVLRRRNAVLLYLTAVLNRDQTRQDQALVLLRTQFGGDEFIDEDFLASTAHARPQAFPPNSPSAQWDQAQKAWDEFQPKVSLDAIDIVLQDEPRHMGAIALRGFVLAAMGQAPEAEVWCRDHLKNHTRSPDLYQALAYVNLRRMKAAEAVVNLRLAHALDPTSALTRAMLAHALAIIARSNEAQAMIQDLLGAPDRSLGAHAHFHLAAAYAAMKQLEATLTHLSACLATSPNHVPALFELTRTSELSKDFEGALKALERAVAATQANGSPPLDLSRSKDRLTRILRETAAFEEVASGRKQESKAAELLRLADFASAILKRSTEAVALIEGIDLKDPAEVRKPGVRFQCARIAMRASLEDGKTSRDQQILAWLQGELAQLSAAKQVPPATRRKFLLEWHQDASIQAYRAQVAERGGPAQSAMEELWEAVWRAEADLDG